MNGPIRLRQGGKSHPYFTKIWLAEPNFREKDQKYYAAAGESGLQLVKRPVCTLTA
jgi:hypothetical protein